MFFWLELVFDRNKPFISLCQITMSHVTESTLAKGQPWPLHRKGVGDVPKMLSLLTALRVPSRVLNRHSVVREPCRGSFTETLSYMISSIPSYTLGSWDSWWQSHLLQTSLFIPRTVILPYFSWDKEGEILLEETERKAGLWSLQKIRLRIECYLWSWYYLAFCFDLFQERCPISPLCNKRSIPSVLAVTISHFKFWSVRWTLDRAEHMQEIYCLGVFAHWTRNNGWSFGTEIHLRLASDHRKSPLQPCAWSNKAVSPFFTPHQQFPMPQR